MIVIRLLTVAGLLATLVACQPASESPQERAPENTSVAETSVDTAEVQTDAPSDVVDAESESTEQVVDAASLLTDMGFSTVEESELSSVQEQAEPERYCLNSAPTTPAPISVDRACDRISGRLASVSKQMCDDAQLQFSQCHSVDGFPILYREFSLPPPAPPPSP